MELNTITYPNPNAMGIGFDFCVSVQDQAYVHTNNELKKSGLLAKKLHGIPGVNSLSIVENMITLYKAEVFSWDEILPVAYRVIMAYVEQDLSEADSFTYESERFKCMACEYPPNNNLLCLHLGIKVADELTLMSDYNDGLEIVKNLLAVEGIVSAYLDQYKVKITKSGSEAWESLAPTILDTVVLSVFGEGTVLRDIQILPDIVREWGEEEELEREIELEE